ncbi:MAG TPA: hypothetical protein VFG11_06500, partial [Acidobacteriota bacterium]|nr:hypothetical protein [Acidobacteriota bacterium]
SKLKQQPDRGPIFIQCSVDEYRELLADPKSKSLLTDLEIELYNPRLISFPFYIVTYPGNDESRHPSLEVAFLELPDEALFHVEEADLLTMLSEVLGRPKNTLKLYKERGPYPAAKKIFDGTYQLIGIYDDEPSVLLDELNINLTEELKAHKAEFVELDNKRVEYQLHEIARQRMSYVFFNYADPSFPYAGEPPVFVALAPEMAHKFPVILSNLKSTDHDSEQEFLRALSYAYFMLLPEISDQEKDKYLVERLYLLNAYLDDSDNRLKGLGFLGFLLLMKDKKTSQEEKEIYEAKCNLLLKKYGLEKLTAQNLLDWLGLKIPTISKRELFTSDVSKLYQEALAKTDQALKSDGKERTQNLEEAQKFLIAALLQGSEPKNIKGGRGLWSAADYNPYYELARVTLYLEMEKQRSAGKTGR